MKSITPDAENCNCKTIMNRLSLVLVLALGVLSLPTTAWVAQVSSGDGASVSIFLFRDLAARAFFFAIDESGTETDVGVIAFKETLQNPQGPPEPTGPSLVVFVDKFNFSQCPPLMLNAFAFVPITGQNFQIDPKLGSASLTASGIELFDSVSQTSFTVDIALNWTPNGDAFQTTDNFHYRLPGFSFSNQARGTFRPAQVSGSISDGTTNFASLPLSYADMLATKTGSVSVSH